MLGPFCNKIFDTEKEEAAEKLFKFIKYFSSEKPQLPQQPVIGADSKLPYFMNGHHDPAECSAKLMEDFAKTITKEEKQTFLS